MFPPLFVINVLKLNGNIYPKIPTAWEFVIPNLSSGQKKGRAPAKTDSASFSGLTVPQAAQPAIWLFCRRRCRDLLAAAEQPYRAQPVHVGIDHWRDVERQQLREQ